MQLKTHSNEKKFDSKTCQKAFKTDSQTYHRKMVHNSNTNFLCAKCKKRYTTDQSLTGHV